MGYAFSQNSGRFKPIFLVFPNEYAIFPASGSVQQNYLFFTIFKISGGKVLRDCPLIQAFSPEGEKVSVTRAMTAREDARPTEKLYHFLYQ